LIAALVGLGLSIAAAGQQTNVQTPQASSFVQGSLKALAGGAIINDVTISATARRIAGSDDETGAATLTAMAAGDSRVELSLPSGVRNEIRNPAGTPLPDTLAPGLPAGVTQTPQPVGSWSGPDGIAHRMATHNTLTEATWFFPAFAVATLMSSQNYVISYVGQETRDGQQVLHLSASQQSWPIASGQSPIQAPPLMQHLSQRDLYLDPITLLPVVLVFNVHPDNNALVDIPVEIRFSDYRALGGAQVPFHVQRYLNNSLVLDLTLSAVTLNNGLTPSMFAIQ
jgi:hypothetical protein